jgi:pSer/pThr/pTyr-binding forkhead associated (FHA) protein
MVTHSVGNPAPSARETPGSPQRGFQVRVKSAEYALRVHDREVWLMDRETIIGRDSDCDIVIETALISERHARIKLVDSRVTIEDLNSRY